MWVCSVIMWVCSVIMWVCSVQSLQIVAVRCLCELLIARPHFNFRNNIISIVVPFLVKHNKQVCRFLYSMLTCTYIHPSEQWTVRGKHALCHRLILDSSLCY